MKNKIVNSAAVSMVLALVFFSLPVLAAENNASTTATSTSNSNKEVKALKLDKATAAAVEKGTKDIDNRVDNLNRTISRINGLKNISDSQKVAITATIQGVITSLNNLKSQIDSADSTTTLKTNLESIASNYRVYALIMPQISIIAAADRATTIMNMMSIVSAKLTDRLNNSTGINKPEELQKTLNDLNSNIVDAKAQIEASIQKISVLTPDEGDKTKMAENNAAFKKARTNIKIAEKDLNTARKDAGIIVKALVDFDKSILKNATSTNLVASSTNSTSTDSR